MITNLISTCLPLVPMRLQAELAPVLRELGPEMRAFGLTIVGRLTEKLATRVLRYTSDR